MYQVSLRLRPNNQITLTQGQYKSLGKQIYSPISESAVCPKKLRYDLANLRLNKEREAKRLANAKPPKYPPLSIADKLRVSPLDITKKSQDLKEKQPRSGFGLLPKPKSFTNASGQKIRECGAAIDHTQSDLSKIHCITLTLPCGTDEGYHTVSAWSGWLINGLFQPIRDKYGDSCLWFFVWEYQKRGALHLHIAVSHDKSGEAKIIGDKMIKDWINLLVRLSEKSGVCLFTSKHGDRCTIKKFWQNDNQAMKKGLGRYFSKYAGKKESKQSWYCQRYPVSRFWGCCYALKRIIKEMSLTVSINFEDPDLMDEYATAIIDKITSLCKVAYCEQYQFQINLGSEASPHIVADGERTIFYVFPDMLMALKSHLQDTPIYF